MSLGTKIIQKVWFGGNLRRVNENNNTAFNIKDIKQTSVLQRPVFLLKANDLNLSIMFNKIPL